MKIKKFSNWLIKSPVGKCIGIIHIFLGIPLTYFSASVDFAGAFFPSFPVEVFVFPTLVVTMVGSLIFAFGQAEDTENVAKESYRINDKNQKISSITFENISILIENRKIKDIVDLHCSNIDLYFNNLSNSVKNEIDNLVTIETLEHFDKIKENYNEQKKFMYSMLDKFSDLRGIEPFIVKEHSNCINELESLILNNIKNNKTLKILVDSVLSSTAKDYNKNRFEMSLDDIEANIIQNRIFIKDLNLANVLFGGQGQTVDKGILASLGILTTTDIFNDIFDKTPFSEAIVHILEDLGAAIPVIGPVFIVSKVFRFLYKFRDRGEELENLKMEIEGAIQEYLDKILSETKDRIKQDSKSYTEGLLKKLKQNINKAINAKKRAVKYIYD